MQKATSSLAPRFLKAAAGCSQQQIRNLNLLEYQAKGLLQNYGVTVQKFKVKREAYFVFYHSFISFPTFLTVNLVFIYSEFFALKIKHVFKSTIDVLLSLSFHQGFRDADK